MKIFSLVLFFLVSQQAVAFDYCPIGSDPVNEHRQLTKDEEVSTLGKDSMAWVESRSGNFFQCIIRSTEKVVLNPLTGEQWIQRCGNHFVLVDKEEEVDNTPKEGYREYHIVGMDYSPPPPTYLGFVNRAYESCPEGSTCRFLQNVGYIVIGAVALRWVANGIHKHSGGGGTTITEPPPPGPVGGDGIPNLGGGPVGGDAIPLMFQ